MGNVPYLVGVCLTPITNGPTIRWVHDSLQRLANSSQHRCTRALWCPKAKFVGWSGPARLSWAFWFGMLPAPRQQPARPPLNTPDARHFSHQIGMTNPLWLVLGLANTSATIYLDGRGRVRGQVLDKAAWSVTTALHFKTVTTPAAHRCGRL